jgi:N4-gp56 family major capsid protein
MTALYNNTSLNSELYAPLVAAAQYAAYENSIARQLATVFDMPANSGKVVQVPVWGGISATNPEEGNAASFADTNTTSINITLSEKVVAHRITDMLRDSAYNDVLAQLGDQAGRAIAEAMDAEVFATFADFTTDVGSTSTEVTADTIFRAAATLRSRKLTGPFYAVLDPRTAYNLKKTLTATTSYQNATSVANNVMSGFYIGQIAGVSIYESALVATDGAVSTAAINAVFAPQAIAHSMRGSIRLETMRQAAFRATDLVITAVSGASVIQPTFGVKLTANKVID